MSEPTYGTVSGHPVHGRAIYYLSHAFSRKVLDRIDALAAKEPGAAA